MKRNHIFFMKRFTKVKPSAIYGVYSYSSSFPHFKSVTGQTPPTSISPARNFSMESLPFVHKCSLYTNKSVHL